MTKTITLVWSWQVLRPDHRQYKQQSIELIALGNNLQVGVDVPYQKEYFINFDEMSKLNEKVILGELYAEEVKDSEMHPILSPAGVAYVMNVFKEALSDPDDFDKTAFTPATEDEWDSTPTPPATETEDWGDDVTTPATANDPVTDWEWEDATEKEAEDNDAPWSEESEDWPE